MASSASSIRTVSSTKSTNKEDEFAAPPTVKVDKSQDVSESSRFKSFLGILKKFVGVADIAAVRFSLPASLLEPIPNLEYWHYLDRPEYFASIPDSDDELGRMLAVIRFWCSKDLKYAKGKVCKPYNSVLGEFFRCSWDVPDDAPVLPETSTSTSTASKKTDEPVKITFLCEQTSHHPPVSAYWVDCPQKGVYARGYDQLSGKFTGTSVKVVPGEHNRGIFVRIPARDEEYTMSYPACYVSGFFRGQLNLSVADTCFIECKKTGIKVIMQYFEEGWIGKAQNKMQGIIYKTSSTAKITKLKDVPEDAILARLEGAWTEKINYTLASDKEPKTLIDLTPLMPVQKTVPPDENQLPEESRQFWAKLTDAMLSRRFGDANKVKQEIEERQRSKAKQRAERHETWTPRFFTEPLGEGGGGIPALTQEGQNVVNDLAEGKWELKERVGVERAA